LLFSGAAPEVFFGVVRIRCEMSQPFLQVRPHFYHPSEASINTAKISDRPLASDVMYRLSDFRVRVMVIIQGVGKRDKEEKVSCCAEEGVREHCAHA
jgi:hypothetical protein